MKKSVKAAIIVASVATIAALICLISIPIVRYRIYHGEEPVFMGNPVMQKLLYHDADVVMLPGENTECVIYQGNRYVGDNGIDWHFDREKMQYAGKIHHRKLLHVYSNHDVYVSEQTVSEQGAPLFLQVYGQQPPFYVLEGYEIPTLAHSVLACVVYTKDDSRSLSQAVRLDELVDVQAKISYRADMKQCCDAKLYSEQYAFMYAYARIYLYEGQYYLNVGEDAYYPVISQEMLDCLSKMT